MECLEKNMLKNYRYTLQERKKHFVNLFAIVFAPISLAFAKGNIYHFASSHHIIHFQYHLNDMTLFKTHGEGSKSVQWLEQIIHYSSTSVIDSISKRSNEQIRDVRYELNISDDLYGSEYISHWQKKCVHFLLTDLCASFALSV